MPTIPDFTPKTPIVRTYQDFAGVDFTSDATNVQINRSPDSVNMYKDYKSELGQAIETRPGFSNLVSLDYPIYGIHFFQKESLNVLIHAGKKMFLWKNFPSYAKEEDMKLLYSEMNEIKSRSFVYGDTLYINDGKNYLYYDGDKFASVKDIAYIPTTTIARNPTGGGTILNPVNLLQPKRRNSFLADGTSRDFALDTSNIDDTEVEATINGELKKEGTDFSVNRTAGVVTFNSVPPSPGTIGQDNIVVTFSKTIQDYDNRIEKCSLNCIYDNRIFYSGNEDYPNALFNSQLNDPTYIADTNYYQDGSDNVPITSLLRVGDSLMVIKADDQQDAVVYYHTPSQVQVDEKTTKVTYPTKQGLAGIGCISKWGSTNFLDEPVFISRLGLESFTKLNLGLERSIEHKSSTVDGKLVNEIDLQNVHLEEWNGYLLCLINGHIYLADNRQKYENKNTGQVEYEWYYWDNIGDFIKKTEPKPFEGDSVFLEDTSNKKIKNLSLVGRSKQATRSGKNKFDGNFSQGYDSNGNITSSRQFICNTRLINVVQNEKYTISNNLNLKIASIACYKDNAFVSFKQNIDLNTINIPENINQIRFNLYREQGLSVYEINMCQLEPGEVATSFEQYGASPSPKFLSEIENTTGDVEVTVCNKNFIDFTKIEKSSNTSKIEETEDTIKIYPVNKNQNFRVIFNIHLKPGNYSMKQQKISSFGIDYDGGNVNLGNSKIRENFNLPKESILISWWFEGIAEEYIELNKSDYQLEKSASLTEYTKHEEQSITFPLSENQRMCEGDYLATDGIHHVRKQIELDGTENWSIFNWTTPHTKTTIFISKYHLITDKINIVKLCSHFKVVDNTVSNLNKDEEYCLSDVNGSVYLSIDSNIVSTVEELQAYLAQQKEAGTPVVIEYELATETVEEYTEEQQQAYNAMQNMKTYEGGTNIFADNADVKGTYESIINGYDFKKATLLKEFDGRLLFGTENGTIAEFKMYQYNDNGRAITCRWTTPADNFKSVNHVKTTNKRGGMAYLKTFPNSVCKLNVKTDKTKEREIARYVASGFSFKDFSFVDFSFTTTPKSFMQYKIKEKKWMNIQLMFYSDEIDKPFGIFMATLEGFVGGYKKGGY